uniref:Uncharacterized protein n=1 Tax=Ditylenchus dipsaci TaxID=166011 RepID=A0A915DTK1_9BILA
MQRNSNYWLLFEADNITGTIYNLDTQANRLAYDFTVDNETIFATGRYRESDSKSQVQTATIQIYFLPVRPRHLPVIKVLSPRKWSLKMAFSADRNGSYVLTSSKLSTYFYNDTSDIQSSGAVFASKSFVNSIHYTRLLKDNVY